MSTISSSSSSSSAVPGPPRPDEEKGTKKVECVCHFKKDLGKLVITDKMVQFRSLHYEEKIPFEEIVAVRKNKSTKVTLKTKTSEVSFGPFEGIRRGAVYDTVKTILEEQKQNGPAPGSLGNKSIDLSTIKGLNDQIVSDIFAAPASAPFNPPIFRDSGEKDPVGINEKFAVNMKTLFAIALSDSSDFTRELHTDRCNDLDLEVGKWSKDPSEAFFTRKLTFRKKQKMVSCTVNQTQRLRFHSPTEVFFETQNVMEGVPFSDCFTVDTIWRWKQESENSTQVNCWIHVEWLKSCWMKGQIEKGSISGTDEYCNHWKNLLLSKFKTEEGGPEEARSVGSPSGVSKPKPSSSDNSIITIVFGVGFALFFVLTLWLFFSGDGGASLERLQALETENEQLRTSVLDLQLQLLQHERILLPRETFQMIDVWKGQIESMAQRLLILTQEMNSVHPTDAALPFDTSDPVLSAPVVSFDDVAPPAAPPAAPIDDVFSDAPQ